MEMQRSEQSPQLLTLSVLGDMDAMGCKSLQPQIDKVIFEDTHKEVEIDLSQVSFLDSSGVGAIVYLYKRLIEKKRVMRIENAHGQPLELITLLRISNAIPVNNNNH